MVLKKGISYSTNITANQANYKRKNSWFLKKFDLF